MPPALSALSLSPFLDDRILIYPRVGPYYYRPIENPSHDDIIAWDVEAHEFAGRIPGTYYFQRNVLFADGRVSSLDETAFSALRVQSGSDP